MDDITSPALRVRSREPSRAAARYALGDPADGTARPARRTPDRRRRRDAEASRARGHGREFAAGAGLRSRLSRGLGQCGDRRGVAVAGLGKPGAEICSASSVGPGQARDRSAAWHAGRRGGAAAERLTSSESTARTRHRRSSAGWRAGAPCTAGKGRRVRSTRPVLRAALRLAVRASTRPRQRKSKRAVTRDVLDRLLATCRSDRLADTRDLAILLLAFASGGRRRSEVARLRVEQLSDEPPVPLNPQDPKSADVAVRGHSARPHQDRPSG